MSFKQCIELPRAIATTYGNPVKGAKSNTTKWYEQQYEHSTPKIITMSLMSEWIPESIVMKGMFSINICPRSTHRTISGYADFLLRQHILPHYRNTTTSEIHLLFDDPECQMRSQKEIKRAHRDKMNLLSSDHPHCNDFTSDLLIPPKWRQDVINCRTCKRRLVCFLSNYFLQKIKHRLRLTQKFVTAGGLEGNQRNQALAITNGSSPHSDERLTCNAEETDTHIWLLYYIQQATKTCIEF